MFARFVTVLVVTLVASWAAPQHAFGQAWQDEWKALAAKVKGQTLAVSVAGEEAYRAVLSEFGKKFGVDIQPAVMRPSQALARIQTEQKNGRFEWDLWMGGTSNMVNTASPAGLLEPMEKYFFLPEVKDAASWRHPDFIFNDSKRSVFAHVNRLEFYVLRNTTVLPDVKVETWDDFLNPKLKGKIAIRDLSVPNAGTFAVATMYGAKGPDVLRRFFKEQDVKIYENPQQLETALNRGAVAVSVGLETYLWDKCRADGGCKEIDRLGQFAASISVGMSVPKNPPHADVVKLWVNWFLSKEGQGAWVRHWAKDNTTGAVSMRKDVAPAPGHELYLPDFSKPEQYVFVSSERGSKEIADTIKIYKEATGR